MGSNQNLTWWQKAILGLGLCIVVGVFLTLSYQQGAESARLDELRRLEERIEDVADVVNRHANYITTLEADVRELRD